MADVYMNHETRRQTALAASAHIHIWALFANFCCALLLLWHHHLPISLHHCIGQIPFMEVFSFLLSSILPPPCCLCMMRPFPPFPHHICPPVPETLTPNQVFFQFLIALEAASICVSSPQCTNSLHAGVLVGLVLAASITIFFMRRSCGGALQDNKPKGHPGEDCQPQLLGQTPSEPTTTTGTLTSSATQASEADMTSDWLEQSMAHAGSANPALRVPGKMSLSEVQTCARLSVISCRHADMSMASLHDACTTQLCWHFNHIDVLYQDMQPPLLWFKHLSYNFQRFSRSAAHMQSNCAGYAHIRQR